MTTLSPAELAALHAELQGQLYSGLSDAQRFDAIHAPTQVANPITLAPQVPKPFGFGDVAAALSTASLSSIRGMPDRGNLIDTINANDRAGLGRWVAILSVAPAIITAAEASTVNAIISAAIADPRWAATVPGPSRKFALFGAVVWNRSDGTTVNFVPLEDITAAR